jgi:hypothetical protein
LLAPHAPRFIEPTAPDARPIIEMHRGNDGHVAFQRRTQQGQFERLFSVRASDLSEVFPEFVAPHVDEESWFSVNAMHLPARRQAQRSPIEPRFPAACWGTERLRWLTACYIDLDCYKLGLSVGQCIGICIDAQDRGVIPPASMFTRSGRGVWLFWFLRDDDDADERSPVRAWPEKISTYRRIERQLVRRFGSLGADAGASDPARITRVPGSMHRITGARVHYWIQADRQGRPFSYRLDELAVKLGVRPTKYPTSIAQVFNPQHVERAKKGYKALHRQRLEKMLNLISLRGTIREGCRNRATLILASLLDRNGVDEAELIESVRNFGRIQCSPPLTEAEIDAAIRKRKGYRQFGNHTIAGWLKITPAESAIVGWPAEGTLPEEADTELRNRGDRRTTRRELVRGFVTNPDRHGPAVPTIRQIVEYVEGMMGDAPSPRTIQSDLVALGIANPRGRRTRQDEGPGLLPDLD